MPSPRPSAFVDPVVTDAARQAQPQSPELRAPAAVAVRADARRRANHPAKPGPIPEEKADEVVALTLGLMDKLNASQIAVKAGVGADGRVISTIIKAARASLQSRAEFYVEAHAVATIAAAAEGNAKPAQWALERIAEGDDRVVDPVAAEQAPSAPTFNLGFMLGGIPTPQPLAIKATVEKL